MTRTSEAFSLPRFTANDIAILKQYFELNKKYYWKVNEELTSQLADHPLWGAILKTQTPEQRYVQVARTLESQRAAIYDGNWDVYTNDLMCQGISYARMNVSYADWYEILKRYKDLLIPHIREDFAASADQAITFLDGLSKFTDYAMHVMATAYFQEQKDIVRASEERFRAIFENSADHIFLIDRNNVIVMVNKVAGNTRKEDVIGASVLTFHSENSIDMVRKSIRSVFEDKRPASYIADHVVDGQRRYYASSVGPIFNYDGEVNMAVVISRDVSEQKVAEDEIKRLNIDLQKRISERTEELNNSTKELDAFCYSVSHDLRTPLRAINGFTQILVEDYSGNVDDEAKDAMHEIVDNVRKMGQLIDDLLEFSRLGRQKVRKTNLDMHKLTASVITELSQETSDRKVEFIVKPLERAKGDRVMVRQVLQNIISNALKYSMKNDMSVIEIGCYPENNNIVYYVKDNGAGFDMQYYDKLFAVFQRLHKANEFEGTGVGLAIVHRIIQKHMGKIWAESTVGEGATFYFTLPT